jgi:phosphoglycerate dehydrogenase-like enzyme
MLHCTVLDDYEGAAAAFADWAAVSDRVAVRTLREHVSDEAQLAQVLHDDEIVVIMRERTAFPESLFDRLPSLRLLVTTGFRNASIDLSAAARHGVTVCGTASGSRPPRRTHLGVDPGPGTQPGARSVALRSAVSGRKRSARSRRRDARLLGLGRIGADVARVSLAFGMHVQAWSQNLTPDHAAAQGVHHVRLLHDLLASSDFVSIHLVLGDRTRGLVDHAAFESMRPSAYLINTARAAIVDQAALLEVLQRRRIAGAGLDVFDLEPLPAAHPFRILPNVLATPHLGYVTRSNYAAYFTQVVEDIQAYLVRRPIRILDSPG